METYSNSHYNRIWTEALLESGYSQSAKDLAWEYQEQAETIQDYQTRSKTLIELKKSSKTENDFVETLKKYKQERICMLNTNNIVPLYQQVGDLLKERINNGFYKQSERIPSEKEIAAEFNVSIITVRKATGDLAEEGLLERKQGKGTFVAKPKLKRNLQQVISFTEACLNNNVKPGAKLIEKKLIQPSGYVKMMLDIDPQSDQQVIYVSRLRTADGEPVALETNQFPLRYSFLIEADMENTSLFDILKENGVPEITCSRRQIEISRASKDEAELLGVPKGAPLILIRTVAVLSDGKHLFVGTQLINGERFTLTM